MIRLLPSQISGHVCVGILDGAICCYIQHFEIKQKKTLSVKHVHETGHMWTEAEQVYCGCHFSTGSHGPGQLQLVVSDT